MVMDLLRKGHADPEGKVRTITRSSVEILTVCSMSSGTESAGKAVAAAAADITSLSFWQHSDGVLASM